MAPPWHVARPVLRAEIEQTLRDNYPDLSFAVVDETAVVHGSLPVKDANGEELTRFAVEITFPDDYPAQVPIVRETFLRIPRTVDRHINPDGAACVTALDEWLTVSSDHSFRAFMEGPVANFFIGQALVELGQPWPFGERSHGAQGLLEAYAELLGVSDHAVISPYLKLLSRSEIKGHWECPCGSGIILRKCHVASLRALQERVLPATAKRLLVNLAKYGI